MENDKTREKRRDFREEKERKRGGKKEKKEDEGGNIAEKVKKKNKIQINERLRSYFTLHSDGKNAGGNLKPRREKEQS